MQQDQFKSFYTDEADVYHDRRYQTRYGQLFKLLHHESITELLHEFPKKTRLLEVACGTGHTTELLSALGFEVSACDLTPAMMHRARQRLSVQAARHINLVETNAMCLPFADSTFDLVVSTRFLHLFPFIKQQMVLTEMLRVLKPNGYILVDFDNWFSRWLLAVPYAFYNLIRYRRLAPFSIYNKVAKTQHMIETLGVEVISIIGIGGTHLVLPAYISNSLAVACGRLHKSPGWRLLAEQFILFGRKK